jgi:hypothetical protein
VLRCARGIAQALGPGGTLSRQAGGFIYHDPANLIVVWNGQVVYGFSLVKIDVLMARLAPALEAAGYHFHAQDNIWKWGKPIASIPGMRTVDRNPEASWSIAMQAVAMKNADAPSKCELLRSLGDIDLDATDTLDEDLDEPDGPM